MSEHELNDVARVTLEDAVTLTHLGRVRRGEVYAIATPYRELQLYVSSTGRALRVWDPSRQRELK